MARRKTTVPFPTDWAEQFRSSTFRTSFALNLSQAMLEYLCAVADDVQWDRALWSSLHKPDNFLASSRCLQKRGLIVRKSQAEIEKMQRSKDYGDNLFEFSFDQLTPAGECVVQLLKTVGMFVESDSAISKQSKRGRRA